MCSARKIDAKLLASPREAVVGAFGLVRRTTKAAPGRIKSASTNDPLIAKVLVKASGAKRRNSAAG